MNTYKELYAREGREFGEADFWIEFGAENVATLFTNKSFVYNLTSANRSSAHRILDWIRNTWRKITGFSSYVNTKTTDAANITAETLSKAEKLFS